MSSSHPTTDSGGKAQAILEAAEALFSRNGFDGVSMSAVAREAGVSKANVYHHFHSKEELYIAVLRNACSALATQLPAIAEAGDEGPAALVGHLARSHLANLFEHRNVVRLIQRELAEARPGQARVLADRVFGEQSERLIALFQGARDRGELREDVDPAMAVTAVVAANVMFFQIKEVLEHIPGTEGMRNPEAFTAALVDIVLHGIAAESR